MDEKETISPSAVVGTAGHIDHGKSALIKALTGIDPDRLPEEKARGITITLGYAHLDLPSGRRVSIVDVPGHERFVKTMAQGASVIQMCLLVVDGAEGVKPQTVEHLRILQAMGVKRGVIVITKCDIASQDLVELAIQEVEHLVSGTFLEGAPVVRTSAVTGMGLEELKSQIDKQLSMIEEDFIYYPFRIPIDRAFTATGFGTVVTGTLLGGEVAEGDELTVFPDNKVVRVRRIEVHGSRVRRASPPLRIALNITGARSISELKGKWFADPDTFTATTNIVAQVEAMDWVREVRLPGWFFANIGSGVFPCRIFSSEPLRPGKQIIAKIKFDQPVICRGGDRFIIRFSGRYTGGFSTCAGCVVVDPIPSRSKLNSSALRFYRAVVDMSAERIVLSVIEMRGMKGCTYKQIRLQTPLRIDVIDSIMSDFVKSGKVVKTPNGRYFVHSFYKLLTEHIIKLIDDFHSSNPFLEGVRKYELFKIALSQFGRSIDSSLFELVVDELVKGGRLEVSSDFVRKAEFSPTPLGRIKEVCDKIVETVKRFTPAVPSLKQLPELVGEGETDVRDAIQLLKTTGKVKVIDGQFVYSLDFLKSLRENVGYFFSQNKEMRISDLRKIAGVSRKYALPLARWLDEEGITIRKGDVRLRRS